MLSRVAEGPSIHAKRNRLAGNPQKTNECGYGSVAQKMLVQNTSGVSGRLIASNEIAALVATNSNGCLIWQNLTYR